MDAQTHEAYERASGAFAEEWHAQPPPDDLYALVREHFGPGLTADIGCGSGRDTAWLVAHGFPAVGYDASPGLLAEARLRHPGIDFEVDQLPRLDAIGDTRFSNVLCETVIMHLDPVVIEASGAATPRAPPAGWHVVPELARHEWWSAP